MKDWTEGGRRVGRFVYGDDCSRFPPGGDGVKRPGGRSSCRWKDDGWAEGRRCVRRG